MTISAAGSSNSSIAFQASASRRAAARRLAADQAQLVAATRNGASEASIDLLFLLQESVLVFDETHAGLATLAAADPAHGAAGKPACPARGESRGRTRRRPLTSAAHIAAILALLVAATALIEIIDPAPLGVQAVGSASAVRHP